MSIRSVVVFKDESGSFAVYKHSDAHPGGLYGMLAAIEKAKPYAWTLPRFEANEFAAAFVQSAKNGPGGVRLTSGPDAHSDLKYVYTVTCKDGKLDVHVRKVHKA